MLGSILVDLNMEYDNLANFFLIKIYSSKINDFTPVALISSYHNVNLLNF